MLTSQGAHSQPLAIIISTQSPSDADFLSIEIDDATRSPSSDVVCHLYTADKELEINDPAAWEQACPAIGSFRSFDDVKMQAEQALRIPTAQASFENLILNRRVSLQSLWLAPAIWKESGGAIDYDVFRNQRVALGLDLSMRNDLTAAVLAACDEEGIVHFLPFVFAPEKGMKEREMRDKAPYTTWVKNGQMVAVPGATLDYVWLCEYMKSALDDLGIEISSIQFDRWRIRELKSAAEQTGFAQEADWVEVGQGFKDFSPRIELFETYLLQGKMRHGLHPLLNMAASNAIVVRDPAGNRKLDKSKATQRIDPLVAAVMATGAFLERHTELDIETMIG
jgi:phage terminase large subunit-like protein